MDMLSVLMGKALGGESGTQPVLVEKSISANGEYSAASDYADGYSAVSVDVANSYTAQDEGKVVSNGALVAQTAHSTITDNGTYDTTTNDSVTVEAQGSSGVNWLMALTPGHCSPLISKIADGGGWESKTWSGGSLFRERIWTDGENIYYSSGTTQKDFDKSTSTWSAKSWTGLTDFYGYNIWTDGENIYYSSGTSQYVLDKSTSTWSAKSWTGLTDFDGRYIWTDGENIFYSNGGSSNQKVLNKSTSTWEAKTWNSLTNFDGRYIWTDGENIYYSNSEKQYVLNKSTSTWFKTLGGIISISSSGSVTYINGNNIWTDGELIYHSNNTYHYVYTPRHNVQNSTLTIPIPITRTQ